MSKTMNKYLKEMKDDDNPEFIFALTNNKLLLDIVKGKIDCKQLAKKTLIGRCVDKNGKPVGCPDAEKSWGAKYNEIKY